jgi:hypothetical protein
MGSIAWFHESKMREKRGLGESLYFVGLKSFLQKTSPQNLSEKLLQSALYNSTRIIVQRIKVVGLWGWPAALKAEKKGPCPEALKKGIAPRPFSAPMKKGLVH